MRKILWVILFTGLCISLSACTLLPGRSEDHDSRDEAREEDDSKQDDSRQDDSEAGWPEWMIPHAVPESTPVEPADFPSVATAPAPDGGETVEVQTETWIPIEKDFGTYRVLSTWEESVNRSTEEKYFYIPQGNDDLEWTDNISVNIGSNNYGEDEVTDFKEAIMQQYAEQLDPVALETLSEFSYITPQGYDVLVFTISDLDGVISRQYYIVADHEHCLVSVECKDDPDTAQRVSLEIVESFVWAEDD